MTALRPLPAATAGKGATVDERERGLYGDWLDAQLDYIDLLERVGETEKAAKMRNAQTQYVTALGPVLLLWRGPFGPGLCWDWSGWRKYGPAGPKRFSDLLRPQR